MGQTTNVAFAVCYATTIGNSVSSPGRYYTRIRFGPNSDITSQFPSSKTATKLRMTNLQITKASGFFFADDSVFDFYGTRHPRINDSCQ